MSGKKEGISLHGLTDKIAGNFTDKLSMIDKKRLLMMNLPYIIVFYLADKLACTATASVILLPKRQGCFS